MIGTLAIGQTLIILTAGIDLSCGTVMAFGSIVMTKMAVDNGVPRAAGDPARHPGLRGLRLPQRRAGDVDGACRAFIVTLGTFNIAFALTHIYSNDETISDLPSVMTALGDSFAIGGTAITYGSLVCLALFAITWFVLTQTSWGRRVYAIGRQPRGHAPDGHPRQAAAADDLHGRRASSTASRRCCWSRGRTSATRTPASPRTSTPSPPWCWAARACSAAAARSSAR